MPLYDISLLVKAKPQEEPRWEDQDRANYDLETMAAEFHERLHGKEHKMHYRNGREAKNGDKLVKLDQAGHVVSFGVLHSAIPGNDYCNGYIGVIQSATDYACICDCLHIDDLAVILQDAKLDTRPQGR